MSQKIFLYNNKTASNLQMSQIFFTTRWQIFPSTHKLYKKTYKISSTINKTLNNFNYWR